MEGHWKEAPTSWRSAPRPRGWKTLRAQALARDGHQCTWIDDGQRCTREGTDADHIGNPEDHRLENLRALCGYHHRKRTALQARTARGPLPSRRRQTEAHPGLIAGDTSNSNAATSTSSNTHTTAASRNAALQRARQQAAHDRDDEPGF